MVAARSTTTPTGARRRRPRPHDRSEPATRTPATTPRRSDDRRGRAHGHRHRDRRLKKRFVASAGAVEAVRGVSFDVAPGRDLRLPRAQRRRQDDDAADARRRCCRSTRAARRSPGFDVAREPERGARADRLRRASSAAPTTSPPAARTWCCRAACTAASVTDGRGARRGAARHARPREFADRRVKTYSGGQRRRLDVALGIVHEPEVLFLDEPTTGLDPQNRANLWDHVRALRERGHDVFLTTHYLEEADALCDRVMIMDHGQIVAEGTPRELKREVVGDSVVLSVARRAADASAPVASLLARAVRRARLTAEGDQLRCYVEDGGAALPELLRLLDGARIGAARRSACPSRRSTTSSSPDRPLAARRRRHRARKEGGMKLVRDTGLLCQPLHPPDAAQPGLAVRRVLDPLLYLALFTPLLKDLPGLRRSRPARCSTSSCPGSSRCSRSPAAPRWASGRSSSCRPGSSSASG